MTKLLDCIFLQGRKLLISVKINYTQITNNSELL